MFLTDPLILRTMLGLGVNGLPVDPATDFTDLIGDRDQRQWLRGAIQPITVRSIAGLLIAYLGEETLSEVGAAFQLASKGDRNSDDRKKAVLQVKQCQLDELDQFLDAPFYSLSPVAPRDQMISDLARIQAEWRERHNLPTTRSREPELKNYLRAWDLREGWENGEYRRGAIRLLKDVADTLGKNKSTTNNWYRSAFHLITGHDFSSANWQELMSAMHLTGLIEESVNPISVDRLKRAPSPRPVDDTTISEGRNRSGGGLVEGLAVSGSLFDPEQCITEILRLIDEGQTDDQIIDEIGLGEQVSKGIAFLRENRELDSKPLASK
ncbi:hypothetical protein K227x_14950 [Rubripirellula lacrimiformis]|uniref:Uncharacterized protein n=2 Tax=Rubripirellula lacrimiformis TaxID=1930273 RepID=A0A517N7K1_9BACT|nr:hypothetical protein K227x_14950 [Rubripirellula lacrimiformis]